MLELILIIALFIAIIFDCIRIVQYIAMRKSLDPKAKEEIADKIDRVYDDWVSIEEPEESFGHYCVKHLKHVKG